MAFGKLHLVPVVADFVALHPGLELQLCLPGRYVDPIDEGVDVPLRLCDASPQDLAAHRLCDIKYAIVASPEMAAMSSIRVPADLRNRGCLVYGFKARQSTWHCRKDGVEEAVQGVTRVFCEQQRGCARPGPSRAWGGLGSRICYCRRRELRNAGATVVREDRCLNSLREFAA